MLILHRNGVKEDCRIESVCLGNKLWALLKATSLQNMSEQDYGKIKISHPNGGGCCLNVHLMVMLFRC